MILLDTSILIDFYRKSSKQNSHLLKLNSIYDIIFVSEINFLKFT
jgi:predicted nucleic acid-binding protein